MPTLNFDSANLNQYILEHSFPTRTFFKTDVSKANNKYSATFTNSQPNLFYKKAGITENYIATKIDIYQTLHTDLVTDVIGEMVVTMTSTTNTAACYLCFLLKKSTNGSNNNIDNFLSLCEGTEGVNNAELYIDSFFSGNCISYVDNQRNTVFIVETPITLNGESSGLNIFGSTAENPSVPFELVPGTFSVIESANISKSNSGEIYIDCQPSGASADESATYEVPINSEYTKEASNLKYMNMIMHFAFFFIVLVICSVAVPLLYTRTVIDQIHRITSKDAATKRNIMVDWLLLFLVFFIISVLAVVGNLAGATIVTIFIALSSSIITMYRQTDEKYISYFNDKLEFKWWKDRYNEIGNIIKYCKDNINNNNIKEKFLVDPFISFVLALVDLFVIIVILLPILMQTKEYKWQIVNIWYPIALFFFALFALLPYGRIKSDSSSPQST